MIVSTDGIVTTSQDDSYLRQNYQQTPNYPQTQNYRQTTNYQQTPSPRFNTPYQQQQPTTFIPASPAQIPPVSAVC